MEFLISESLSNTNNPNVVDWLTVIAAVGALIFSVFQLYVNGYQKKIDERKKEIFKKLNSFYGPFSLLRQKSNILYEKFQSNYRKKDKNFSTLRYLLAGYAFDNNEVSLLEEIIDIGQKSEKMLHENAGLIDDETLSNELIPKASTHYLLLRLAYEGKLQGDHKNYIDSTFPRKLDTELNRRKRELEAELEKLNKKWFLL